MAPVDFKTAQLAKRRLQADLGGHPDLNGIGIAPIDGGYMLKVNLLKSPATLSVPDHVGDVDVNVDLTGPGFPQAT